MHLINDEPQELPYPAYRWYWQEKLSYTWKHEEHINYLEMRAFMAMLRRRVRREQLRATRYVHEAYGKALQQFLLFIRREGIKLRRVQQLDAQLGEYLNILYQEGDSLAAAGHRLSSIKRFIPEFKQSLPVATQFYRNWQRFHVSVRATPIPHMLLEAMAACPYPSMNRH